MISLWYESWRGHLYMKVDIILVKQVNINGVIFQDQTTCTCILFRDAKHAKLGGRVCFLAKLKNIS